MGLEHIPRANAGWPDRLDRYYTGHDGAEERAAVEAYLAEHPEVVRFFDMLRGELAWPRVPEPDFNAALSRIKQTSAQLGVSDGPSSIELAADSVVEIPVSAPSGTVSTMSAVESSPLPLSPSDHSIGAPRPRVGPQLTVFSAQSRWRSWTAGLMVGMVAAVLVMTGTVAHHWWSVSPRVQGGEVSYLTRPGQHAEIELNDGTHVVLNVASRLDVGSGFGRTSRTVHLTGEAYFRVARSSGMPFVVDAGHTSATVLGTEFGVRSYDTNDVRVAVRSGKVAVGRAVLIANDMAHVAPAGVMTIASHQNLDAALGFVTGKLVLNNVPLRTAIPDLNRWYNADIQLGDPALGNKPIEASLVNGSIGDLKEILQVIFHVQVVQDGRTLTLYPR